MTNFTVRAIRATILLGDISLDVFQLPNGEYRLNQTQTAAAVEKDEVLFRQFRASKAPEALQYRDFKTERTTVEGSRGKAKLIPLNLAVAFWTKEARVGNQKAILLLGACALENIERRADAAFGIQRTEIERNEKLAARLKGIETRKSLTDAIKFYIERHPELSDNDKRFLYKNCSDKTNKVVFGKVAKKVAEEIGCDRSELREHIEVGQVVKLTSLEDLVVRLIEQHDVHPNQAVVHAAERLLLV